MRKAPARGIIFFLCLFCTANSCIAQLHIGSGTTWVSTTPTTVVLDNMNFNYDAGPVLLNNIFRFTGTAINSIGGANHPLIYAISLAKTNPGILSLNQTVNLTKRVNFGSGLFDLNGNGLLLQPEALLTNENENSRLIGPSGGYASITLDLHAPVASNPGNLGALITSATDLGQVNIARSHDIQILNDSTNSIARWYDISVPDNITPPLVGLRLKYFYAESQGFINDSLVMYEGNDDTDWPNIGYTTRDASQKFVEKQGITRLSRFTLAPGPSASTPPPVTPPPVTPVEGITLLTGSWNNDLALLNWTAVSEYQNDHFNVERKYASESDFTVIASLPTSAPGGTRSGPAIYSFTDSTVRTGPDDISYRIHQVASNGQMAYSNIVTLKAIGGSIFIKKLFPTIAIGGRVYIEIGNKTLQKMSFAITDSKGALVMTGNLPYQSQWLPVYFLSKGLYHLVLRSGDQKFNSTFIK